jgi:hypothetical protein
MQWRFALILSVAGCNGSVASHGVDSGVVPGVDSGVVPGADSAVNAAVDAGVDSAAATAGDLGDDAATLPAADMAGAVACARAGAATMSGPGWFPGATATQLDSQFSAASPRMLVSPDESHVAIIDDQNGSFTCGIGPLTVESVVGPGCAATTHALSATASTWSLAFSADSRHLLFLDGVVAPCQIGTLELADGDGGGLRTLASSVIYARLSGRFAVYVSGNELYAAPLDGGATAHLGSLPSGAPQVFLDPTGNRVAFGDATGALALAALDGSGAAASLASQSDRWTQVVWSPDGAHLAFGHGAGQTLTLVNSDGGGRADIAGDFYGDSVVFSPDGTLLAYDSLNPGTTYIDIKVHRLGGGADLQFQSVVGTGGGCGHWGKIFFSPDGAYLFADNDLACAVTYSNMTWGAIADGRFRDHFSNNEDYSYAFSNSGNYLAFSQPSGISVLDLPTATTIRPSANAIDFPLYEAGNAHRLLIHDETARAQELVAEDGSGTPIALPGVPTGRTLGDSAWVGPRVVYGADPHYDGSGTWTSNDLRAASDDGATLGLLATFQVSWAIAPTPTASRIFVVRNPADAGAAAAGLWLLTLP